MATFHHWPDLRMTEDARNIVLRHLTSAISGGAQSARRLLIETYTRRARSLQAA
jgi:hypothetical protein